MTNDIDKIKSSVYIYTVASFDILYKDGSSTKIEPSFINGFNIDKSYDDKFFPIFKINFNMRTLEYYKLLSEKTTVKFRFRLQKHKQVEGQSNPMKYDVINDIFCAFITTETPFFDADQYKRDQSIKSTDSRITPEDINNNIELFLFKEVDLNASKKIVNIIRGKSKVSDMLLTIMSKAGFKPGTVLMSPMDNNTVYPQLVSPPSPSLGAIKFIEETYDGFYNEGSVIFFDLDKIYILRKTNKCTAWAKGEYKQAVLNVLPSNHEKSLQLSSYQDSKTKQFIMNVHSEAISITASSMTSDQLVGNNFLIVDPKSGAAKDIKNTDSIKRGDGTYKVLLNTNGNTRMAQSLQQDIKENSRVITAQITDTDYVAFHPNTEYVVNFKDMKSGGDYSGKYRLSACNLNFRRTGDVFLSQVLITLK